MRINFEQFKISVTDFIEVSEVTKPNYIRLMRNSEFIDEVRFIQVVNDNSFDIVCKQALNDDEYNVKIGSKIYSLIYNNVKQSTPANDSVVRTGVAANTDVTVPITNSLELLESFESKTVNVRNISTTDIEITFKRDKFFPQSFPDFILDTFKGTITIKPGETVTLFKQEEGYVYRVYINANGYDELVQDVYGYPIYYFSNVTSLKEALDRASVESKNYSDVKCKEMIADKSMMIKRGFGIFEEHCFNIELQPILKELCNLYNVKEQSLIGLISYSKGSGTGEGGSTLSTSESLKLGNFQTKMGTNDTSGGSSTSVKDVSVSDRIYELEQLLRSSISRLANSVHNYTYNDKRRIAKLGVGVRCL